MELSRSQRKFASKGGRVLKLENLILIGRNSTLRPDAFSPDQADSSSIGEGLPSLHDHHRAMINEISEALEQQIAIGAGNERSADSLGHAVHREIGMIEYRLFVGRRIEYQDEGLPRVYLVASHPRVSLDHRGTAGVEDVARPDRES